VFINFLKTYKLIKDMLEKKTIHHSTTRECYKK